MRTLMITLKTPGVGLSLSFLNASLLGGTKGESLPPALPPVPLPLARTLRDTLVKRQSDVGSFFAGALNTRRIQKWHFFFVVT
jgi:DNA helicase HerA-like ATPase